MYNKQIYIYTYIYIYIYIYKNIGSFNKKATLCGKCSCNGNELWKVPLRCWSAKESLD